MRCALYLTAWQLTGRKSWGYYPEGVQVALCDGSVPFTPNTIAQNPWRGLLIIGSTTGVFPGPHTVIAEDPLAAQGAQTSHDPDYVAVTKKFGPKDSPYKITIDKDMPNLELKLG